MPQATTTYSKNIPLLYIIKFVSGLLFSMPIFVIFLQDNGLGLGEVFMLQAVFGIAVVIAEIPTGYIGDVTSRKFSLITGSLVYVCGCLLFAYLTPSLGHFIIAEIFMAVGYAFISGSDSALLYDSMLADNNISEFKKVKGRFLSLSNFAEAGAALIGGRLAVTYNLSIPFVAQGGAVFFAFLCCLFLIEPPRKKIEAEEAGRSHLIGTVRYALHSNKKIRSIIFFSTAISLTTFMRVWYVQPLREFHGIDIKHFGRMRAAINASVGLFSLSAHGVEKKIGLYRSLWLMPIALIGTYIIIGVIRTKRILIAMLMLYAARGIKNVILADMLHTEVTSDQRATIFSVSSLMMRLSFTILGPIAGWFADIRDLRTSILMSAVILGIGLWWSMNMRKGEQEK